jgi:DNA repair protein RadC
VKALYSHRVTRHKIGEIAQVRVERPQALADFMAGIFEGATQESMYAVAFDGRNNVISVDEIYKGTATGTSVRISELFKPLIVLGGVGLAIVHNHPSNDPEPSEEDINITAEIIRAGRVLDVEVLDHLVIGEAGRFTSIRSQRPSLWDGDGDSDMRGDFSAQLAKMLGDSN